MLMGRSHVMLLLYIGCLAAHLQPPPPPPPRQKPSTGSCSTAVKRRRRRARSHVSARAFKCSLR